MKTRAIAIGCVAGLLMLVAAPGSPAGAADQPARGGPDIQSAQTEAYNGPKARIAVADFEDKMSSRGQYRIEYGRGLSDMLTTALFQTNRYIVLEREKLTAVVGELKHGTSDLFRRDATAALGGFAKTPMESAIREMIEHAVAFVVSKTPATYYRFGTDGAGVATAPQPSAPSPANPPPANLVVPAGLQATQARATASTPDPAPARPTVPTVTSDADGNLLVKLDDVKLRGAVLSVVMSLHLKEGKAEPDA